MISSAIEVQSVQAVSISVDDGSLCAELSDGRSVSAPLAWYPRLMHATAAERLNFRLIGGGQGIHWPELDESVSVENLLAGKPSAESARSLQRWLTARS